MFDMKNNEKNENTRQGILNNFILIIFLICIFN